MREPRDIHYSNLLVSSSAKAFKNIQVTITSVSHQEKASGDSASTPQYIPLQGLVSRDGSGDIQANMLKAGVWSMIASCSL